MQRRPRIGRVPCTRAVEAAVTQHDALDPARAEYGFLKRAHAAGRDGGGLVAVARRERIRLRMRLRTARIRKGDALGDQAASARCLSCRNQIGGTLDPQPGIARKRIA